MADQSTSPPPAPLPSQEKAPGEVAVPSTETSIDGPPNIIVEAESASQFQKWRTTNRSDLEICGVDETGYRGGDANIESADHLEKRLRTVCADATARVIHPMSPGGSQTTDSEQDGLPAGDYRFVVELRDCRAEQRSSVEPNLLFAPQWRVIEPFKVEGYSEEEAKRVLDILNEPALRKCETAGILILKHLKWYLPRTYARLVLDIENLTFRQRVVALELLFEPNYPASLEALIEGESGVVWALPAAAMALDYECEIGSESSEAPKRISAVCEKAIAYVLDSKHKEQVRRNLKKGTLSCAEDRRAGGPSWCDPLSREGTELSPSSLKHGVISVFHSGVLWLSDSYGEEDLNGSCRAVFNRAKERLRFFMNPAQQVFHGKSYVETVVDE